MISLATLRNAELAPVVTSFRVFADTECGDEPLYRALCEAALREPQLLALLGAARPEQRRPNLMLAAVQYLLLRGARHQLAAYYPSLGGNRQVDDALHGVFSDFCETQRALLLELIATRTTQTNEVGRCAVLWPVLRLAAKRRGFEQVALLDFGASAGLNLGMDRLGYDYGDFKWSPEGTDAPIRIQCRLLGGAVPTEINEPAPRIVTRLGVDTEPVDVNDEDSIRWLRACVWPHDKIRRERFDTAVSQARKAGWCVERHLDCTTAVERWAQSVPLDVLPVVVNSWVLTYLGREARAQHIERMRELVQRRGAVWISGEAPDVRIDEASEAPPLDPAYPDLAAGTLWTLTMPGNGKSSSQIVARSHPHGKWMQWLA